MNVLDTIYNKARNNNQKIVLAESEDERTLQAIKIVQQEKFANIILIGNRDIVSKKSKNFGVNLNLDAIEFVDPINDSRIKILSKDLYELRKTKGMTIEQATQILAEGHAYLGIMLMHKGIADGFVNGAIHRSSADTIKPALHIIKAKKGVTKISSLMLMILPDGRKFIFSDCGLMINPTAEELAEIAYLSAQSAKLFDIEPKIAMLSFSTKGSGKDISVDKVRQATEIAKIKHPELVIDGELQIDTALVPSIAAQKAPHSVLAGNANVLIFPDLNAGNIGYKLVQRFADAKAIGPVLQGLNKPVSDLSRGCSAQDIVDAICIVSVQALMNKQN